MTLKAPFFFFKSNIFCRKKFWENILTYFQRFSAKLFRFWSKKQLILQNFGKIKKEKRKICQNEKIWAGRARKTGFFFQGLVGLPCNIHA